MPAVKAVTEVEHSPSATIAHSSTRKHPLATRRSDSAPVSVTPSQLQRLCRNTTAKVAAVACVLLQSLAPGVLAGDPVATGALPRLQHGGGGDSGLSQEFHRHLMSFDVSAGVKGSGCGGNFQKCCPEDTCGEPTLTCVQSTTCLKCGTSGRHVCTAEGTEPCGAGLVDRQGICFTDFGISFGGSGPGAPPPLGSYGGPPPAPAPTPDPEPEPVPGCVSGLLWLRGAVHSSGCRLVDLPVEQCCSDSV